MKLSNGADPTATLESEREDVFVIDLEGSLILSRNSSALRVEHNTPRFQLRNASFHACWHDTNRFQRFWTFTKAAWRFSK